MPTTGSVTAVESHISVRGLVERRAADGPDSVYLTAPETGRNLTFGGLEGTCRALAAWLDRAGVKRGGHVALLLPNGRQAVRLFVGIMTAGRVVVPLSLIAQPVQLAEVIEHSDCTLVVAAPDQADVLRDALARVPREVRVVIADPDAAALPGEGDANGAAFWPDPAPEATDPALLMYTSGTTGRPKGVLLSHGNVLTGARFVSAAHGLGPRDRVLAVLPLYHINAQIVTVLAPLHHGGSLVLPRRFSVSTFWRQAAAYRCTWLNVVPTIIAYLLQADDDTAAGLDLSAVRFCRSASAPLPVALHLAFEARFGIGIIETMGLTETAAPVFSNPLEADARKIGSPGRPFGCEARIVDVNTGQPLPDGAVGEIQVRGPNVMAGYYKAPVETRETFTADGWLRTGDLGQRDADGFYVVTGRRKELIIKGGENIAPREIDEVLLRHPAVLEAAAVGVPDPAYGQDIEAAVVLRPGVDIDASSLREYCLGELGRFKAPRRIRIVAELPKGPSGKVQRLKLRNRAGA